MRIIKEINQGPLKITVFKYQEKISIKFEKDLNEILIRFREGGLEENNIDAFLTDALINSYIQSLDDIDKNKFHQLAKMEVEKGADLPDIM